MNRTLRSLSVLLVLFSLAPAFGQSTTTISNLPAATTPLAGTEQVPMVQGGVTKKAPVSAFTGTAANPSATIGASAVNGSATTYMRSDAAPALPATLPALDGSNLTSLNPSNLSTVVPTSKGGTGADNSAATGIPVYSAGTATVTATTGTGAPVRATSPTLVTPNLGTPSAATLTNATGLPVGGISATGTASSSTYLRGDGSWSTPAGGGGTPGGSTTQLQYNNAGSFGGISGATSNGTAVTLTSPTLVTPALGTPASGTLTNATGLPISTGVSGLGTGVATALGTNVGSAGAPVVNGGALGTPSSGTLTNGTGLPISTGVSGLGTGVATGLANAVTGSGAPVLATSPTLVTPNLGTPSAATLTNATGLPLTTGVTGTLPAANGGTGITSLGTGVAAALGTNVSGTGAICLASGSSCSGGGSAITIGTTAITGGTDTRSLYNNAGVVGERAVTGSGNAVLSTSPTLVTPALGTPSSGTLTNTTGLPISTGVSGLGTGVATALAITKDTSGGVCTVGGGGCPSTPGGSNTQLQYNNSSAFGGISGATTDGTSLTVSSGNLKLSGSSSGTAVVNAPATGGGTITLPAGTDTLAALGTAQTFSATQTFTSVNASTNTQSGTTYSFAATDCGKIVIFTNASAVTATIPASIVPSAGTACLIVVYQAGAGRVSVNGSAVTAATLVNAHSYTKTFAQYSVMGLSLTTVSSVATAILSGDGGV